MNVQFAHTMESSSDLRVLNDFEIDEVNGGLIWFLAAGAYLLGVGAVAGYYATKAIISRCSCSCD